MTRILNIYLLLAVLFAIPYWCRNSVIMFIYIHDTLSEKYKYVPTYLNIFQKYDFH